MYFRRRLKAEAVRVFVLGLLSILRVVLSGCSVFEELRCSTLSVDHGRMDPARLKREVTVINKNAPLL